MKEYPVDLVVVLVYDFSGLVVSAIVGLIMERNLDAWKIKPGIVLTTMIYMVRKIFNRIVVYKYVFFFFTYHVTSEKF